MCACVSIDDVRFGCTDEANCGIILWLWAAAAATVQGKEEGERGTTIQFARNAVTEEEKSMRGGRTA